MGNHGWDAGKEAAEAASSGGLFFKLESDKDKALLVWCGDPYSREVFWTGTQYVDADSDEGRVFADNNPKKKPSFRCAMNAFVLDEKNDEEEYLADDAIVANARMAIFENGVKWFKDLVKIKNKFGLGLWIVEIQRSGKAQDTNTTYSMLPDRKVEEIDGLKDALEAAEINDLENPYDNEDDDEPATTGAGKKKKAAGKGKKTAAKGSKKKAANGVIAADDATTLITELKQLERSDLDEFMSDFKIKRVKELPGGKLEDALAWINAKKDSGGDEVDPFA